MSDNTGDPRRIDVLDKGYVRLLDWMGSDLSAVNAARASYAKEKKTLDDRDERLLSFLATHSHTSPFRHAFVSFEVYAPLFVCRQWWKYSVGSNHGEYSNGWNEASRRYVTMEPEFYVPKGNEWRSRPENSKQGSGEPIDHMQGVMLSVAMDATIEDGLARYNWAMELGVAPELARGFLPAYFMYTCWRWSASFQAVAFFLDERLDDDAQQEIQLYARAVRDLVEPVFPKSIKALLEKTA